MLTVSPSTAEWSDAWIEGEPRARWRSASALGRSAGAQGLGASLLEVPVGCALGRHVDSAEETVIVLSGRASVAVGDSDAVDLPAGGLALIPENEPHVVGNAGDEMLRFAAIYAAPEVVTTYEQPVQPDGRRERRSAS